MFGYNKMKAHYEKIIITILIVLFLFLIMNIYYYDNISRIHKMYEINPHFTIKIP